MFEVAFVAGGYIAISLAAVRAVDLSAAMPSGWHAVERDTGGVFLVGATVQAGLVLAAAYLFGSRDFKMAIAAIGTKANRPAWFVALAAAAIHIATGFALFLPEPQRVLEPSGLNLLLSAISGVDGWSQEVIFRGYVLFRLGRAGLPLLAQILLSGALFSAIHIGYIGEGWIDAFAPMAGTFILGSFLAWAFHIGNRSLRPVLAAHVLIIIALQPWLALAR